MTKKEKNNESGECTCTAQKKEIQNMIKELEKLQNKYTAKIEDVEGCLHIIIAHTVCEYIKCKASLIEALQNINMAVNQGMDAWTYTCNDDNQNDEEQSND